MKLRITPKHAWAMEGQAESGLRGASSPSATPAKREKADEEEFYDYNRCLPATYNHKLPEEGRKFMAEIKDGLATCLVTHDSMLLEHFFKQLERY